LVKAIASMRLLDTRNRQPVLSIVLFSQASNAAIAQNDDPKNAATLQNKTDNGPAEGSSYKQIASLLPAGTRANDGAFFSGVRWIDGKAETNTNDDRRDR